MPKKYPEDPKEQYEFLVEQAERYISNHRTAPRSLKQWRTRALEWLKTHAPNSGLAEALLVVPVYNCQRGLSVLLRSRSIVPFLRDNSPVMPPTPKSTKKVFIVHGHNEALKNAVARLLAQLRLEPIILHEQPNRGRTIIEKFFGHSDVAFAIVLLTGDDRGGLASDTPDSYKPRARQNVILELGFFLGRIGRERTAVIYDNEVEIPSDYSGVLFVPYDDQGVWRLQIAKELKAAGLKIDLNQL